MRIKVKLFSTVKESDMANKRTNFNRFRAKSIILTTDSTSLNLEKGESETLKCLKSCIKDNGNTIDYNEMIEFIDTNNIMRNNFWNEDEFEGICRFEFKDYFDFSECKFQYL